MSRRLLVGTPTVDALDKQGGEFEGVDFDPEQFIEGAIGGALSIAAGGGDDPDGYEGIVVLVADFIQTLPFSLGASGGGGAGGALLSGTMQQSAIGGKSLGRSKSNGGRRGGPDHRARVDQTEREWNDDGWRTESGGSLPEKAVRVGGAGRIRYPDLVMARGARRVCIQVGRKLKSEMPVIRERRAIQDLEESGEFSDIWFIPYN